MFKRKTDVSMIFPLLVVLLSLGLSQVWAQEEESPEAVKYREDYERLQKITATADTAKRADLILQFMKDRPDSKVFDYAQGNYLQIVDGFAKAEKYPQVITLCEKFIKLRPRVGEAYYYYGAALKNTNKVPEAMDALAKSSVLKSNAARKAREFLEYIYRSQNGGSMAGLDKLVKKAEADIGK